jgi:hypothetical protein
MKFSFFPEDIKAEIDEELIQNEPIALARSNMAIDGHMGISFIVAYKKKIYLFTQPTGSSIYTKIESSYGDISSMEVTKELRNAIIKLQIGKKKYTLKFSPLEEKNLNNVLARWYSASMSPFEALIAGLMFLASEDDNVSIEENDYILKVANNDQETLNVAHNFFQNQPIETLFDVLQTCEDEQKYCIMANLLELAMCDGVLHSKELKLIRMFAKSMDIEDEEYETIKQIMVMKNQTGILKT